VTSESAAVDRIGAGNYAVLTTFKRDGTPVATAVWIVRDGPALAVWTDTYSGKVKRIRRNPRVTVAPSTFNGRPTGEAVPAHAELMDPVETERVRTLIKKKYRLTGPLTVNLSKWRRGVTATIGLRLTLDEA
jgi:PPOX class probable F420-dependent enzyme